MYTCSCDINYGHMLARALGQYSGGRRWSLRASMEGGGSTCFSIVVMVMIIFIVL